jgi:hypothetical protein
MVSDLLAYSLTLVWFLVFCHYPILAYTSNSPIRYTEHQESSLFVPFGASLNSFQAKIPHRAATTGAELLSPYDMAGLAEPTAMKLTELPRHHIAPPNIPNAWTLDFPLK